MKARIDLPVLDGKRLVSSILSSRKSNSIVRLGFGLGIASIAVAMRVYGLNGFFGYDYYDEGVYWQSLRAMHAGLGLYDSIFYAQPPLFVLLVYPFYAVFGQSILAARAGIAVFSLLGLLGAYLTGRALAGWPGALAAMILLVFTSAYLALSLTLVAEGPATALMFLSVGAALLWSKQPVGNAATLWAIVCGGTLAIGILIKLLDVSAGVPILILVISRLWTSRRESDVNAPSVLMPVLLGFVAGVAVVLLALMPFLPSSGALWNEVVRFHLMAAKVWQTDNFAILGQFVATNDALGVAASFGALLAFLRRDWLVAPLLAWLATTLILLAVQSPLFKHHLVVLVPPLISLAVLGLGDLPPKLARMLSERLTELLMRLLVLTAVLAGIVDSYRYYRHLTSPAESDIARSAAEIAVDLRERTTADQWTITDAQFITALADRDTPPWLVDTSRNRILAGYLTTQELLANASNPRVHAVLFATNRLALEPTANFHDWVLQHFALARRYGPGVELWIR